jgi:hypothetical protein
MRGGLSRGAADRDYLVTVEDLRRWEADHDAGGAESDVGAHVDPPPHRYATGATCAQAILGRLCSVLPSPEGRRACGIL